MWRTLRQPRWLLLLLLLVVIVVTFARLGLWQLSVAHNTTVTERMQAQAEQPRVELTTLLTPHGTFPDDGTGRPVTATGRYDVDHQFLVPGRRLGGVDGYWVITPLVVEATGARLVVLRGFVTAPEEADRPQQGVVTVEGALAPGESPAEEALPEGQHGSIDLAHLVNAWPGDLYNAFIFRTAESPTRTADAVQPVPPPSFVDTSVDWRNFGYALQWWVFAAFAVFMFLRFLAEAAKQGSGPTTPDADPDGRDTPGTPGDSDADSPPERTPAHHV